MKYYRRNIVINKKDGKIMQQETIEVIQDPTYHNLSSGYKFDEISMNKMAEKANKTCEKWDLESEKNMSYFDYLYSMRTFKDFIKLMKMIFDE